MYIRYNDNMYIYIQYIYVIMTYRSRSDPVSPLRQFFEPLFRRNSWAPNVTKELI
jgi:hypothetical protein